MTTTPRRLTIVAACGLLISLAAACSQPTGGNGSPTSSTSSTTSASASGAPKVANPKNLKAHKACQLLTPAQLQSLGAASTPKEGTAVWGEKDCEWGNDNLNIGVSPDTTQGQGLAIVYENMSGTPSFQPLTIAGYPAARTSKQTISCSIGVGTSDTQVFLVDLTVLGVNRTNNTDPCAVAQTVATDVLSNLPAGQ